jgi:hypothetical protein
MPVTKMLKDSITERVAVDPADLFALITDIERLPEWNGHIHHVVEAPPALTDGAEWVVQMRANGARWHSRSHLQGLDPAAGRFAYFSRTDDDNPSRAYWSWELRPMDGGTEVTVTWDLHPETFFRQKLAAPIRYRQLHGEVRSSIGAAAAALADQTRPRPR